MEMHCAYALHELICDSNKKPVDYRFLDVNSAYEVYIGLSRAQLLGKTALELFPDIEPFAINTYGKVALSGESAEIEHYHSESGRSYCLKIYSPEPGKFITLFHDITEYRNSELELRRNEAMFRSYIELPLVGIAILNQACHWLLVNDKFCEIVGYSREELSQNTWLDLTPPSCRATEDKIFQSIFQSDQHYHEFEKNIVRSDGNNIRVQVNISLFDQLFDYNNDSSRCIFAVVQDISKRSEIEARLRKQESRLRRENAFLLQLASSKVEYTADFWTSMQHVLMNAAIIQEVDRVSLWQYSADYDQINCLCMYDNLNVPFSDIGSLDMSCVPGYLEIHQAGKIVKIINTFNDSMVAALARTYYYEAGIFSVLDAPIWVSGKLWGLLSFEKKESPRFWSQEDEHFAISIATMINLIMETRTRYKAQAALEESQLQFKLAITAGLVAMWDYRPAEKKIHTTGMRRLLRYDGEKLSENWSEWRTQIVHPDDLQMLEQAMLYIISGEQKSITLELRLLARDGTVRWFLTNGRPNYDKQNNLARVIGTCTDISDRKSSLLALKESDRRFRHLLEHIDLLAIMLDTEGNITFCNNHLVEILGFGTQTDIKGMNWFENFIIESEREEVISNFETNMQQECIPSRYECYIITKDRKLRLAAWNNTTLKDTDGNVIGMASIGQDMTEYRDLQVQYHHAQKMEAIGQLAGGVAHDFNNLLQVISGYTDLASSKLDCNDGLRDDLSYVSEAATRGKELVRQLLTFSRRSKPQLLPVDLNDCIEEMIRMIGRILGEHIQLKLALGNNIAAIQADTGQLGQVLMNLCVNARDAMPDGGDIVISTENEVITHEMTQHYTWARMGDFVKLTVIDTGVGMDQDTLSHIFEPFYTSKSLGKGTGLGLATVYGIMKQHNGFILANSEEAKGTEFHLYFPVTDQAVPSREKIHTEVKDENLVNSSALILIAEDEEFVLRLVCKILENEGYQVLAAMNAEEALELFYQHKDNIDLAMLDMIMPGINGYELAGKLREMNPALPILFSSGYSEDIINEQAMFDAGYDSIPKPYERQELLDKINELIYKPEIDN